MGKGARIRREHENEQLNAPKQKENGRAGKIIGRVIAIVVCLAIVCSAAYGVVYTTGVLHRNLSAMTVGDQKVSALEFQMYYNETLNNVLYYYGSYGLTAQNVNTQLYDEERTWGDYIRDSVTDQLTELYVMVAEAAKAGYDYTADEEVKAQRDAFFKQVETSAADAEMDTEEFIQAAYGNQMRLSDFEQILDRRYTYLGYSDQLREGLGATSDEVEQYYAEHADEYDKVAYRYFTFPYETVTYTEPADGEEPEEGAPASEEEATAITEENKAAAEKLANEMLARITDEQSFIDLAYEYADEDVKTEYEEADKTLVDSGSATSTSPLAEWYKSSDRQEGDTAVIENGNSGYTVAYFLSRSRDESSTVNVRHILFQTETAAEDATDEEKAAIDTANAEQEALAQQVYDEWKNGDATEDSFAALAREYSSDGNAAQGGIYENVAQGDMVAEFNDWIFDPDRRVGDTGIVQTSYGYHIMYFSGKGLPAWEADCRTALLDEKYEAEYQSLLAGYEVTTNSFAMTL